MSDYLNAYVSLNDVENKNPFIKRKPDLSSLPSYARSVKKLPKPIWDGHETEIEAYYKAWKLAFKNLGKPTRKNGFVSPYIDAAFCGDLFMWDSCFMLMFGKYADAAFKFQGTLDNFYCKQEPDGFISRQIREKDGTSVFYRHNPTSTGPELMAWCEWQYYLNYGDKERLKNVYYPLLCYHRWLRNNHRWKDGSYWSSGWGCGMDNMPRCDSSMATGDNHGEVCCFHHGFLTWIDANSQAVLSCRELLKMAKEIGTDDGVKELTQEMEYLCEFINAKMWSDEDNYYYDLKANGELLKAKTVASYWTLLAGIVPDSRKDGFVAHLQNEKEFNRPHRVPTISADEPTYDEYGNYWNGSIWAPTNYMILKALSDCKKDELAYDIALNHYKNVIEVYKKTGTFWENYAPEHIEQGGISRKDFVGWTGIVPITVFIEYVLGIRVFAHENRIEWRIHNSERHGVEHIPVGKDVFADLICEKRSSDSEKPQITVKCSKKISVKVFYGDGQALEI